MKKFTFLILFAIAASSFLSNDVFGQIAQRGAATTAQNSGTTITISKPAGVVAGDVLIANIAFNDNDPGTNLNVNATANGWKLIDGRQIGISGNNEWWATILYRVADGSEGGSFVFNLDTDADGGVGSIVAFSGVDVTGGVTETGAAGGPFDLTPGIINNIASDNQLNANAITTVTANAAVIMLGSIGDNNTINTAWTATSPATLTQLYDNNTSNGADDEVAAAWGIKATAGSTGNGAAGISASDPNGAILIAFRAAPGATLSPSATQNISAGGTVNFTATATNYGGSGSYTYTWSATGATIPGSNPNTIGASSDSKTLTFPNAGTYTVDVMIARSGATTLTTNTTTVVVAPPPNSPIGCNGQYYVSHGPSTGSTGNTLIEKLSFAGLIITPTSFPLAPGNIGFNAIGLNPIDGYMYAVRYPASGAKAHLLRIGTGGTNETDLGVIAAMNNDEIAYSGCFDANGDFYFTTTDGRFMKIVNPVTSLVATQIVATGFANFADIAINPVDGQMYGTTNASGTSNYLFPINKTTGAIGTGQNSSVSLGGFFAGLFFDEVGNLFGYRSDGPFYLINKADGEITPAGTAVSYSGADGCGCSFGRVYHDLAFTANPGNQVCPTVINPNPTFPLLVSVTNQSSAQQTGLTYTLNISDPLKRLRFTQSAATIKANLITAGLATASSTVTLTTVAPATGTNYNKVVVTGFQTGSPSQTLSFTLQVQLYTTGGSYNNIPLQSEITGLSAALGSNDLSNDPATIAPDDPTVISFCPGITLPVDIISFTAKRNNAVVDLKWTTATEFNNTGFYIERTLGGSTSWEPIAFVASQATDGNSSSELNYGYADANNFKGISQYRLRQVDKDGRFKISDIRVVRGEEQKDKVIVFPNPSEGNVTVLFGDNSGIIRDVALFDMSGRMLKEWKGVAANSIQIDNLTTGMYTVRIFVPATGNQTVEKIIVSKR